MPAKILIVGAGAVGQVFALHLSRGGGEIAFLVKPSHPLEAELRLFPQARGRATLSGFRRLTSAEEVARERWDQVWLAVPSNALSGAWLPELLEATGDATVVALAPESEASVPDERLVLGAIPFMAWQQPLPGGSGEPGVAYWVPPLARIPLSGLEERVKPVAELVTAGGLPIRRVADTAKLGAPVNAALIPLVAALELAGWSLRAFRGRWPRLAASAAREAMRLTGVPPAFGWLVRAWSLRWVLWLTSRTVPFDLEAYLRYHFTKVGTQTRVLLGCWLERGRAKGLPVPSIEQLVRQLPQAERTTV